MDGLPQGLSFREAERRFMLAEFTHLYKTPVLLLFDYAKARDDDGFVRHIKP
jgi:hypothetical protein